MTTTTYPPGLPLTGSTPAAPRRVSLGLVVAGSVATGLLGALALTLGVFGGAGEHAVTGSALLAFGIGWGLLAALSIRLTDRPQRWAAVPAVAMAVTGLGLLAVAPDNGTLTAAGWVWPPVVLLLAGWIGVQVHRTVPGRSRWLLYPVVVVLAAAAVGGGYQSAALARAEHGNAMPGVSYDVGGHRLHLDCTGSGSPTVVLENGLGETSALWSRITAAVGRDARVCAYDRAGQGWSGDAAAPQDGRQAAAGLRTLLDRAHERGPYVLVGHSSGGAYALTYASRYPADVAGMVLLDSATPYQFTALPDFSRQYATTRRLLALAPSLARLGATHLLPSPAHPGLPAWDAARAREFATSPRGMRSIRDEMSVYPAVFEQAKALTTLDGRPLVVVTATDTGRSIRGWSAAQDRLAALSARSSHRLADSSHVGLLDEPAGAEVSVRAIEDVVRSVRTGSPLLPR